MNAQEAAQVCIDCIRSGYKILICGNGGSAAQASHFAAELVVRYASDRRALPCISLCADQAIITACANDFGYEGVFSRQVEAYGRTGDVLIAVSTSGRSRNVNQAINWARGLGMTVIAAPRDQGLEPGRSPTAVIQEEQMRWLHDLAGAIEEAFVCP